jgi:hypothetical protein
MRDQANTPRMINIAQTRFGLRRSFEMVSGLAPKITANPKRTDALTGCGGCKTLPAPRCSKILGGSSGRIARPNLQKVRDAGQSTIHRK